MFSKKKVSDYSKQLSIKYNIPEKKINKMLIFAFKNINKIIESGEDIRIPGFGHIYFDKKNYAKYIKKIKQNEKRRQNK